MKKLLTLTLLCSFTFCGITCGQKCFYQKQQHAARFVTCDNCSGAGFFWVDTQDGKVWWANPANSKFIYYGRPAEAFKGNVLPGRFIPFKNKDGAGLFLLDVITGEGWWTNGAEWKRMELPKE